MARPVWHVFTALRRDAPLAERAAEGLAWHHETAFADKADADAERDDYRDHDRKVRLVRGPA